jgi:hypothetical protein
LEQATGGKDEPNKVKDPLSFEIWIFRNGQQDYDDHRRIFFVSCTFCFQFLCIVHFWEVGQWLPSDLETVSGIPVARGLVSGLPVAWMLVSGFPLAWRLISGFPLTWRPSVDFSVFNKMHVAVSSFVFSRHSEILNYAM